MEDSLRGEREDIKGRLQPYVGRLLTAGAGQAYRPVLDIGCGRGEFLQLLDWLEGRWFRDRATDARDAELFSAWRTLHARLMAGVP